MRGVIPALPSPHPLGRALPAVYQEEDGFTMRLTEALDEILAPILSTLDNLSAYFDPRLTPDDFLGWLASWVAFDLDETWDHDRRREAVRSAVDLLRRRGTALGLADEVRLVTGAEVEIVENGGSAWSLDAMSPMVGTPEPTLLVRIRTGDPTTLDLDRIDRLVNSAKPAHVPHTVEVVGTATKKKGKGAAAAESDGHDGPETPDVEPEAGKQA